MKSLICTLTALALATALFGQGQGKGNAKGKPAAEGTRSGAASVSVVFTNSDRQVIRQWASGLAPSGLPPGLAKRGDLPPGLEKQLRKNGTLPPGLQKKVSPFPDDLTRRLTPLPPGYDRVFVDRKALIVAIASRAILDVISVF